MHMTFRPQSVAILALGALACGGAGLGAQETAPIVNRTETAHLGEGRRVVGKLVETAPGVVGFAPSDGSAPLPLERLADVSMEGPGPDAARGAPPFLVQLGASGRISGRLLGVDPSSVRLDLGAGHPALRIGRAGVVSVVQRPGEVQVVRDGFESPDLPRWTQGGEPRVVTSPRLVGERALRLPAGGASVTNRLADPLGSGRFEIAYHDDGTKRAGQRWFVDLTFRKGPSELAPVRVVLGWAEETLAVETPAGPGLNVQPLSRKPGWHRLSVRFDADRLAVSVDGDELAHGHGPGGPLSEVRLATEVLGDDPPPDDLAAVLDDLRLVRFAEPSGRFEVDPSQDELRLISGDQLFGQLQGADGDGLTLRIDTREVRRTWAEVSGVYFRRAPAASEPIEGLWVRVEWRSSPGNDARDLDQIEAALVGIDEANLSLQVPYLGRLAIPRDRVRKLTILSRARRIVVDPNAHHLGDRVTEGLDPPQPETTPLEMVFPLDDVPARPAWLVLDVVQVIGETGTAEYSELVKKGRLRTSVSLNEVRLDDLNTHVGPSNDTPQRIRIRIPEAALKAGKNVLRFDQNDSGDARRFRDNMGILGVAVEFEPVATPGVGKP